MTFFIGVDLHKTQFTVHVRTEEKVESLDQIKQYPTTTAGYAEFLSRIETYKATGAAVKIGVESIGNTRFFKNQVEKAGAEVTVINTLKFMFFAVLFVSVLLLIRFLKSKKSLKDSNEYLLFTIKGQEEERARIARELHDTIAQDLRYCRTLLEKKNCAENIPEAVQLLGKSLSDVRLISYNLSPADITKKDLRANLVNLCASMAQTCDVKFRISMPDDTDTSFLNENDILNLYRIVQESLTNVIKHANAGEAVILIRNSSENEEKGLYIFISDDGCGFDYDVEQYEGFSSYKRIGGAKHFGLIGMKKRCQLIGAEFSVSSAPGEGTQISIFKRMN